jgi:hypothetical protein
VVKDPPVGELRTHADQSVVWPQVGRLPPDALWDRVGRLFDCHHLAIVDEDTEWLWRLDRLWREAPPYIDELRVVRALGEIGLGLAPGGTRPYGWSPAEQCALIDEAFLLPSVPTERAWLALAEGEIDDARGHLAQASALHRDLLLTWRANPEAASAQVRAAPGAALGVELRALGTLVQRRDG